MHFSPTSRSHDLFRGGRLALLVFLAAALSTCGGGKEESEKSNAALEKAREEADELLATAKKLNLEKLNPQEFAKVKKSIDDGLAALDEGKTKEAKQKLQIGVKNLKRLIEDSEKLGKAKEKVAAAKTAAGESQKKADAVKAAENAKELYGEAVAAQKQAEEKIAAATSTRAVDEAVRELTRAKDLFEQARQQSAESQSARTRYEEEKKVMVKQKELAKSAGAEEKAANEWISAEQAERDAEASLGSSNPGLAIEQVKQATALYRRALDSLKSEAEIAAMMEKAQEEGEKIRAQELEREEQRRKEQLELEKEKIAAKREAAKARKAAAGAKGGSGDEAPAAVVLFDGYNLADYPQELDNEDEAFLMEHMSKLSKAGVLNYDAATNGVSLNYTSGRMCQKDIDLSAIARKEYVYFEDPLTKGQKAKTKEEEELMAYYSFSGNTEGTVTFPVPFRYYVRMEFDLFISTMDSNGTWGTLLMYDKRRKNGYMSEWLRVGVVQSGTPKLKAPPNAFVEGKPVSGSADQWHLKFRGVPYFVEYRMPNPAKAADGPLESGLYSVIYDHTTTDAIPAKYLSKSYKSGLVGFTWNRTKFQIRNLVITGVLDKEAAVTYLRELTKIKKGGKAVAKKSKKPKKTETTEAGGGNGNGGGDETAAKPKKKKKPKADAETEGKKEDGNPFDF